MRQKLSLESIENKSKLLPEYLQKTILKECNDLDTINNKLPKILLNDKEASASALQEWLNNSRNFIFLPFLWDLLSDAEKSGLDTHIRVDFAQAIADLLKSESCSNLRQNLYYANFNGVNLTRASLFFAELVGATFVDAVLECCDLTNANAESVDFSKAKKLTDEQIYQVSLRSLYRVRFKLQDEKDPFELRFRITFTYAKKLAELHNLKKQTVQDLLAKIELSGFSPFEWACEEEKFNQAFERLKNGIESKNFDSALITIKNEISDIVPKTNLSEGCYYKNRLNTNGADSWKPIFAKNPRKSRTQQIEALQKISECTEFNSAVQILMDVKTEIEQEWNIWDSELLRQVNDLIRKIQKVDNPSENSSFTSRSGIPNH